MNVISSLEVAGCKFHRKGKAHIRKAKAHINGMAGGCPDRAVRCVAATVRRVGSWPEIIIRSLTGDSYHYLAIARKANISHIYTYDGVHVTNGFHPLWQYAIRSMFSILHLQSHESQAIAVMFLALAATTVGIILASAAVIRMTNQYFLGLLLVPGLYYIVIGVHINNLSIWAALDGMESAFSVLFGGIFFFVLSQFTGVAARRVFEPIAAYRGTGAGPAVSLS